MNTNTLLHLTTKAKIYAAMRKAIKQPMYSGEIEIRNKRGKLFLKCFYLPIEIAKNSSIVFSKHPALLGQKVSGFYFTDKNHKDVTSDVLLSLKMG